MLEISSFEHLISLVQSCSCDLRRSLLTLQFLAQSSQNSSSHANEILNSTNKPKFQSSCIFDTMFYSYLREQWDESILKTYFDNLTIPYTSQYEQSYSLSKNRTQNNAKR